MAIGEQAMRFSREGKELTRRSPHFPDPLDLTWSPPTGAYRVEVHPPEATG